MRRKMSTHVNGGPCGGSSLADPGLKTPIGMSGKFTHLFSLFVQLQTSSSHHCTVECKFSQWSLSFLNVEDGQKKSDEFLYCHPVPHGDVKA